MEVAEVIEEAEDCPTLTVRKLEQLDPDPDTQFILDTDASDTSLVLNSYRYTMERNVSFVMQARFLPLLRGAIAPHEKSYWP
ncbi:Hypothetical predicted protein [Mytilus galloprovincialis]|uniref:Uncharacterized protein n=1 Tax=Mytilus galloprovincialis TaxID=29158 RepID=A0A8B6C5X9_MYTGA|nr:Hypothetical predicted protein [Mytilus galloprovincialis]